MRTIYKYKVGKSHLIPSDYSIVHVGLDPNGDACVWAMVDPDITSFTRVDFCCVGTDRPFSIDAKPIGTLISDQFVWHILEFKL